MTRIRVILGLYVSSIILCILTIVVFVVTEGLIAAILTSSTAIILFLLGQISLTLFLHKSELRAQNSFSGVGRNMQRIEQSITNQANRTDSLIVQTNASLSLIKEKMDSQEELITKAVAREREMDKHDRSLNQLVSKVKAGNDAATNLYAELYSKADSYETKLIKIEKALNKLASEISESKIALTDASATNTRSLSVINRSIQSTSIDKFLERLDNHERKLEQLSFSELKMIQSILDNIRNDEHIEVPSLDGDVD